MRRLLIALFSCALLCFFSCSSTSRQTVASEDAVEALDDYAVKNADSAPAGRGAAAFESGGASKERVRGSASVGRPQSSGLSAGYADDNKQFNAFLEFLKKYEKDTPHYAYNVEERIMIRAVDKNEMPLYNARVTIANGKNTVVAQGNAYSDGAFFFYPLAAGNATKTYTATVTHNGKSETVAFARNGKRTVDVVFPSARKNEQTIALDMLFILDTTGSMGEEIERLKATIDIINMNLSAMKPKPNVRFGLTLYRDTGDEYVTKKTQFTDNLNAFRKELNAVSASGGGDAPEDMQSALKEAVQGMQWNDTGLRLAFLITDATAHLDYGQSYTYIDAANEAAEKGIKIFSVGTGGLPLEGEYILRQIAQRTYANYIFLTYGERGESEGGAPGSVSHHTGANFTTDKLESIIITFAKEELMKATGGSFEVEDDYFFAQSISAEKKTETLEKLFAQTLKQLKDYAAVKIDAKTPAAALPLTVFDRALLAQGEYFSEQIAFALVKSDVFKAIERKDMQKIIEELSLSLSGAVDETKAAEAGKLIGAKYLITGALYQNAGKYEIILKLLNVETAEAVSAAKAIIDRNLGL